MSSSTTTPTLVLFSLTEDGQTVFTAMPSGLDPEMIRDKEDRIFEYAALLARTLTEGHRDARTRGPNGTVSGGQSGKAFPIRPWDNETVRSVAKSRWRFQGSVPVGEYVECTSRNEQAEKVWDIANVAAMNWEAPGDRAGAKEA